ncbi:MAG: hypothetical protein JXB10_01945 [Pirellulales bacterium]|nr:hypothetical protein [Pirellulales bacterium]
MDCSVYSLQIRRRACWKLLAVGLLAAVCLGASCFSTRPELSEVRYSGAGDVALYRAEIEWIRGGEGYYQAALRELTGRGYPTQSVFNWRTPLPTWLIARLPPGLGKALLASLGLLLLGMAFAAVARDGDNAQGTAAPGTAVPGRWDSLALPMLTVLLLTGPLLFLVMGDLYLMPVLWSGVLITLSLCAYGVGRPGWGWAFGLAAVFCRDLALPYALLAAALAAWNRRRRELLFWMLGLAAWGVFFGIHAWRVYTVSPAGGLAHQQGWLRFGGMQFLFDLVQINAYLINLPHWAGALYFVAAMVGFAGWNTPWGRRMTFTACLFLTAFSFIGQEFNRYWGALIAPLLCFGVARFPFAIRDLWDSAWMGVDFVPKQEFRKE